MLAFRKSIALLSWWPTLTEKMLYKYQEDLPISDLPNSFRDAVSGLPGAWHKYLWIDALCILQDSSKDWEKDSAHTDYIYSEFILNIAAACANSSDGLFKNRRPISQRMPALGESIRIPGRISPERIIGHIYVRPRSSSRIEGNTLETRDWSLQETLLASRTIYFGRKQLFWHCRYRFIRETDK